MGFRIETVECLYCKVDIPVIVPIEVEERDNYEDYLLPVPRVDDNSEWNQRAIYHNPDCEWIQTRAHRVRPSATTDPWARECSCKGNEEKSSHIDRHEWSASCTCCRDVCNGTGFIVMNR